MILILYVSDAILIGVHGQQWSGCAAAQPAARSAPLPICVHPPVRILLEPGFADLRLSPQCFDLVSICMKAK